MSETDEIKDRRSLIHGQFEPASVFAGMGVRASMPIDEQHVELRVWRLSPHGIEIIWHPTLACEAGQSVFLRLHLGTQSIGYTGVVVSVEHFAPNQLLVGLVYEGVARRERPFNAQREGRLDARWDVDKRFYPMGVAKSPISFHDSTLFTVADVSPSGLRLLTSMRNKFLLPGLSLDAQVSFPPLGTLEVRLLLKNAYVVDVDGEKLQSFGALVLGRSKAFSQTVGEYILRFGRGEQPTTPAVLQNGQLNFAASMEMVDWGFVDKPEDIQQIESLKTNCADPQYSCSDEAVITDMKVAKKVLVGRLRGRIVATASLGFLPAITDQSPGHYAFWVGRKKIDGSRAVQISDVVLRLGFGSKELLDGLYLFAFFVVLQSGRELVCKALGDGECKTQAHLGFQKAKMHQVLVNGTQNVSPAYVAVIPWLLAGRGLSLRAWRRMFETKSSYASHSDWQSFMQKKSAKQHVYTWLSHGLDRIETRL